MTIEYKHECEMCRGAAVVDPVTWRAKCLFCGAMGIRTGWVSYTVGVGGIVACAWLEQATPEDWEEYRQLGGETALVIR